MVKQVTNVLVLLAGGVGKRYKADRPKQYTDINGVTLLQHGVEEMSRCTCVDRTILVLNDDHDEQERIKKDYDIEVITGGAERAYSFQNAIDYINEKYPYCKKVVFHEIARPLVKSDIIDKYFALLDKYDYVESCKKISDSLGSYVQSAPRREDYYLVQAPEAYRLSVLNQYYDCDSDIYFAANQFPSFVKGYQFFDIPYNIKLTTPDDRVLIEYLLNTER